MLPYIIKEAAYNTEEWVMRHSALIEKVAVPWAAIGKGIANVAAKGWANPLSRRVMTGAAVGGVGNTVFGSPEQGSLAKRFITGAAVGGAAGGAYHGAVRMGMPTATAMGTKAMAKAKPIANQAWQKGKNLFSRAPKWGSAAGAPVSVMPPMPNIMF